MDNIQTNGIIQNFIRYYRKHNWILLFAMALVVLLLWGKLTTRFLPLVEFNIHLPQQLSEEDIAPGWTDQGAFRSIIEPWLRWDTGWYLLIAKEGYNIEGGELAYPPLYPILIRLVGKLLGGQMLVAALIISWTSFFMVCVMLEERFMQYADQKTAVRAIRNLLLFPTAVFFFAAYTESLFLFLVLLAWRFADKENWWLAGLVGALATLSRFVGIVLVLPFGLMWIQSRRKRSMVSWLGLLLIPLAYFGWGFYTSVIYQVQPSVALNQGWALHFDWPWVGFLGSLKIIFSQPIAETLFAYIDVLTVILAGISIYWWLRRKAYPEVLFMAAVLLISLMKVSDSGILGSTSRYILPLFPIYLMLSEFGSQIKSDRAILITSVFLWLGSAAMFFSWNWIA